MTHGFSLTHVRAVLCGATTVTCFGRPGSPSSIQPRRELPAFPVSTLPYTGNRAAPNSHSAMAASRRARAGSMSGE